MKMYEDAFTQSKVNMFKMKDNDMKIKLSFPQKPKTFNKFYDNTTETQSTIKDTEVKYIYSKEYSIDLDQISDALERDLRRYSNAI